MKLNFDVVSDTDSNGNKEYAILIRGQFPITQYRRICHIQDELVDIVDSVKKPRKTKSKECKPDA